MEIKIEFGFTFSKNPKEDYQDIYANKKLIGKLHTKFDKAYPFLMRKIEKATEFYFQSVHLSEEEIMNFYTEAAKIDNFPKIFENKEIPNSVLVELDRNYLDDIEPSVNKIGKAIYSSFIF